MRMANSGQMINYANRPAKCVERKIIAELLAKMPLPRTIDKYRYIGFGSFYFADFILFHNQLGIEEMISIENSSETERFEFNKPYKCISMCFYESQCALIREIDFSKDILDFLWLDYDGQFSKSIVDDLITTVQKVKIGSVCFCSFNPSVKLPADNRYEFLLDEYGEYMPKLRESDIDPAALPKIFYKIIEAAIEKSISTRNIVTEIKAKVSSFFFVKYRDGAPMVTIGFYIHNAESTLNINDLPTLPGVTLGDEPIDLKIPCFTRSEIGLLNRMLPGSSSKEITQKYSYFKESDVESYIALYKFYPNFSDTPFYT